MFTAEGNVRQSKIPFIEDDEKCVSSPVLTLVDTLRVDAPFYNNGGHVTIYSPPSPSQGLMVHSEFGLKIFEVRSIADENVFSEDNRNSSSALQLSIAADTQSPSSEYIKDHDMGFEVNSSGIPPETRNTGYSSGVTACPVGVAESATSVACPDIEDAASNCNPVNNTSDETTSVKDSNNSRLEHSIIVSTGPEISKSSSSSNNNILTDEKEVSKIKPKPSGLCISTNTGIDHNYSVTADLEASMSASINSSLDHENQSSKSKPRKPGRPFGSKNSRTQHVNAVFADLKSSKSSSSIASSSNSPSHENHSSGIKLRSGRSSFSNAAPGSSDKKQEDIILKSLLSSSIGVTDSGCGHTSSEVPVCSVCQEKNCKCSKAQNAYYCCLCKETFESEFMFNVDQKFHSAEKMHRQRSSAQLPSGNLKPYMCNVCQQAFPAKFHLLAHKITCYDTAGAKSAVRANMSNLAGKKYKCRMCQQEFSSEFFLAVHLNTHTLEITIYGFPFGTCPETSPSVPLDVQDSRRQESDAQANESSHENSSSIYLEENSRTFQKLHPSSRSYNRKSKLFTCRSCSMVFSSKAVLFHHQINECRSYKLRCKFCQERFGSRSHLLKHYQSECAEKPLKCDICSKGFIYQMNLVKHNEQFCSNEQSDMPKDEQTLSSGRVKMLGKSLRKKALHSRASESVGFIKCRYCSKTFKTKRLLSTHKLINCRGKPFKCKTCHASFALVSNLYLHKTKCSFNKELNSQKQTFIK